MSVNRVILVGHLGADPESRYLPSGAAVVNFTVATSEKWTDKESGEKKEKTEWSRCSAFGKLAEIIVEYCKKGSFVYLEGKLATRQYEKDGQKHYTTEIRVDRLQMLGPKPAGATSGERSEPARQTGGEKKGGGINEMDDDIPF